MGVFFIYILKSSVCLVLFYLFFRLLLSKETFHRFNRMALLGVLFFHTRIWDLLMKSLILKSLKSLMVI